MKTCSLCQTEKPLEEFSKDSSRKDGRNPYCKVCRGSRRRDQYKEQRGASNLWYYHHITLEQFDKMLTDQGGRCRLCQTDSPGGSGTWHVDHDHACCPGVRGCGKCVRGLLCVKCNMSIGHLEAILIREKVPGQLSVFQYLESRADIHG